MLPSETRVDNFYKNNNNFFETKSTEMGSTATKVYSRMMKNTITKFSSREDQKRFKYVEILNFAK